MTQSIYEILYIVNPELGDSDVQQVHQSLIDLIGSSGGEVRREDVWGRRRLAYEVKGFTDGIYGFIEFNGTGDTVNALKDHLKVEIKVLRNLITTVPKAKLEEEKRKAEQAAKQAAEAEKRAREEAEARAKAAADAAAEAEAESENKAEEEGRSEETESPESTESREEPTSTDTEEVAESKSSES